MWTCARVLILVASSVALSRDQFYQHGHGLDQKLPKGHEVPSPEVFLEVPVSFYDDVYDSIFINNFGVLSFRADIPSFINTEFPLPYASIAAFYTNVDTTHEGSVFYRETNEPHILTKAEESVQNNFQNYYDFKPTSVFIATWLDVTYTNESNLKNSFQIAIISNGTESFVELLYPEHEIQWIERETSSATTQPDAKAQAGFVSEDGRLYTLRGSGSYQIRNIPSWTNTHIPGKYVFRVGPIQGDGNIEDPDQYDRNEVEVEEASKSCSLSGPSVCHVHARCVDYQAGICCRCSDGYYGNGKSCIKDDIPIRVHGYVNGVLNNVHLNDINIQAYVVVADGRPYTALAHVPPTLGRSLILLNVLGGVIGWLFAKPVGAAKNGYQLTGAVFNHTADIWFPATDDRVTIHQEFDGHDVFDQISIASSDIRGTVPVVLAGTKLDILEYEEQYTVVQPGLIRSEATRTLMNKETNERYEQRISQTISYIPCRYAPITPESMQPLTMKATKNYLGYETKDNIVRYGSSNKIQRMDQEDPCIKGQLECDIINSLCIVQGEDYGCVCKTGYHTVVQQDGRKSCVDVDECVSGTHNCDGNADCYNLDGSFQCSCHGGYVGNGITCRPQRNVVTCNDIRCSSNAQCTESDEGPICLCKQGYTGDGSSCWQIRDHECSICSPYAVCDIVNDNVQCQCITGYSGDGLRCEQIISSSEHYRASTYSPYRPGSIVSSEYPDHPRPEQQTNPNYPAPTWTTPTETTEYETDSSPDYGTPTSSERPYHPNIPNPDFSEEEYNETFILPHCSSNICTCPPGYSNYVDDLNNELCRYDIYSSPHQNSESILCNSDTDCPPNAVCSFSSERDPDLGQCVCPEGYEGDAYECIERTGPSCSCGSNAHCVESAPGSDQHMCVCNVGYGGDGYDCRPSFGCRNDSDCESHAECRPDQYSDELICQCIEGYAKDFNDACIPDAPLCNGAQCTANASCLYDPSLNLNYCHCDDGFEGDAIAKCVPISQNENSDCFTLNNCHPEAICIPSEVSYQCVCKEGWLGDGYNCVQENNCRVDPYLCSQQASCLKRSDGYVCECNAGYSGNGSYCKLDPRLSGNFLVLSEGATIFRVPFEMKPREYATPISSSTDQIAVGLDVDCVGGKIYWGDVVGNTIKRVSYDGSGSEVFLRNSILSPEGIAVDWSARNIFWTDSKKLTIEVANLETRARKVLFAVDGIYNPRGIVVHPHRGKIFWSDWMRSNPKIEWANMDGTQRGVFLDKTEVTLPNSLAIDWVRDRLCYADAGNKTMGIKCVGIDTLERETITTTCLHPFSLAINSNKFYWTDWKTMKVESYDLDTRRKDNIPMTVSSRPYGLAVAPGQCPSISYFCTHANGGCSETQLCLANGQGRTCVDRDEELSAL